MYRSGIEQFTVDAALLRELGEQLVGAPYIALAELIKNSYDADAEHVEVRFTGGRIDVSDDGHGMSYDEFRERWMRVGSPHKAQETVSRTLGRPLTGSKGVGRLAAQFLGSRLEMSTTSENRPGEDLVASIDWEQAVKAPELTSATVEYRTEAASRSYPSGSTNGTRISIEGLRHSWDAEYFKKLAREIWFLRPPFSAGLGAEVQGRGTFDVSLKADLESQAAFESQLRRVLDLWKARLLGRVSTSLQGNQRLSTVQLMIEFDRDSTIHTQYELPPEAEEGSRLRIDAELDLGNESMIDACTFEIRIFDLRHKQRFGIKVKEARDYFNEHGGVHVYDGGFRVPLSGPEADWLGLEIAHSHRLATTRLLPPDLRVVGAANHLPTNSRVFGAVHINTSKERRSAAHHAELIERDAAVKTDNAKDGGSEVERPEPEERDTAVHDHLQLQVSRDRLVRNHAFLQLRYIILRALEHYATEEATRRLQLSAKSRDVRSSSEAIDSALDILALHEAELSPTTYRELRGAIERALQDARVQANVQQDLASQLATFASAGSLALVYDHEISKQIAAVERMATKLRSVVNEPHNVALEVAQVATTLEAWSSRARGIRTLVKHLREPDPNGTTTRFLLQPILRDVTDGARFLARGIPVDFANVPEDVRLPRGLYAGWIAVFQNLLVNAANAIVAKGQPGRIAIDYRVINGKSIVRMQDTGVGANLSKAESYFLPFHRDLELPPERRSLSAGGTGLGLTIVRMIANDAHVDVQFHAPDPGFATAIELRWEEAS